MRKIPRYLFNKYSIALIIFLVIIIFFDKHNLVNRWKTSRKVKALEKEIQYYKDEIESNKEKVYEMQSDARTLEKYAREKYYLKKDSEDIFIVRENE